MCRTSCERFGAPEMVRSSRIVFFSCTIRRYSRSMWIFQEEFWYSWRQQSPALATRRNKPIHTRRSKAAFPRQYCLGLIEAWTQLAKERGRSPFPRQYCLGLIEAYSEIINASESGVVFRGNIASASLKRLPLFAQQPDVQFPRQYCLGLIEALEDVGRGEALLMFPRQYCLGLIEAGSEHCTRSEMLLFPRQYCLGLIEAQWRVLGWEGR